MTDLTLFVGRLLIAQLFLLGAVQKLSNPEPAMGLLAEWGLPTGLIWPALAFNLLAGLCLVLGIATRSFAAALAAYCAVTSVFHFIPADPWQMSIFVKNWAIAGGALVLAAHGAGQWALQRQS